MLLDVLGDSLLIVLIGGGKILVGFLFLLVEFL